MPLKRKYKVLLTILGVIALTALFYTFFIQIKKVSPGHIGVKATKVSLINNGDGYNVSTIKGYVVFMPLLTELTIYPTTIQTKIYADSTKILSSDGNQFIVRPSISYQIEEGRVVEFYKSVKNNIDDFNNNYLKELINSSYSTVINGYTTDSLVQNIEKIETKVFDILAEKLQTLGLQLKTVNSNIEIPKEIEQKLAQRAITIQNALLAKERMYEVFAKANLQRLEDSLRYSVLSPLIIQKLFIDKWDGKMSSQNGILKAYKEIIE